MGDLLTLSDWLNFFICYLGYKHIDITDQVPGTIKVTLKSVRPLSKKHRQWIAKLKPFTIKVEIEYKVLGMRITGREIR